MMEDEMMLETVAVQQDKKGIVIHFGCAMCGTIWPTNLLEIDCSPTLTCPNECITNYRLGFPEDFNKDGSLRERC